MRGPSSPIVLPEFGDATVELTSEQAAAVAERSERRLTITPAGHAGLWKLKARSYVGTIVTPDVRILIKPKVPIANLFAMLEAGGKALPTNESAFDYGESDDLIPSFSTFYARHLEKALSAGVPREYFEQDGCLRSAGGSF